MSQIGILVQTGFEAYFLYRGFEVGIDFSVDDRPEPRSVFESPVARQGPRRPALTGTTVAMDDLQNVQRRRIPDTLPGKLHIRFGTIRMTRRVCNVDRVDRGLHGRCRRRNELLTTLTELKAIARAATMGWSRPNAARGMPTTL